MRIGQGQCISKSCTITKEFVNIFTFKLGIMTAKIKLPLYRVRNRGEIFCILLQLGLLVAWKIENNLTCVQSH